ncbi:flagellar hook-length control protein FliK [Siccirubricoccus deserti]
MTPGRPARLTVALEPETLGRVEVRIERDAAGDIAAVRVLAERPETLALLQRDAREFDRSLAQAGCRCRRAA